MTRPKLQGRLHDPDMSLGTDPRTNPKLVQALRPFQADQPSPDPPLRASSASLEEIHQFFLELDGMIAGLYAAVPQDLPEDSNSSVELTYEELVECKASDGHTITLHVWRPKGSEVAKKPLPALVYLHGGGMVMVNTVNKVHTQWNKSLALTGLVVIAVDYRNAWTAKGWNHFPIGLNDCAEAVKWIAAHKKELNIGKIVLQGESGGGNLLLATGLKAKREGWVDVIDGLYASVPYISGVYGWEDERALKELPSLVECAGYTLNRQTQALFVKAYDPEGKNAENPLAWPYWAKQEDLEGLPPTVVSVNELDPLRDEGMEFWRKAVRAGVKAVGKMNLGIPHAAEMIFRGAIPEDNRTAIGDIKRFVDSL
jgi:acetyl esterase